ncbi:BamA/TamA family outer membrane protein [candidate division TA06 bacterium]|nr:BamA/TamA family outer membrane protein [candidate division TA06 bacterium]
MIREGSRFFVGKIQVEGASLFTRREITSQMNTRKGEVFRDRVFEDDVEDLLQRYEDRGYPFCRIEPYGFRLNQTGSHGEEGRVDFGLHIEEGPLVRIEGFEVRGNQITREGVITREFRLKKGDLYSQKRIDRGRKELEALPFIKVRRIELLTPGQPNRGILQVEVEEGRMNRMEGFLGYKPPDGDEEELIGSVQITLENFLGTGRGIQGRWERLSSLTSSLQIEYKEPWLFRIPLHGSIDFLHTLQDTLYTESQVHLKLETPLTPTLSGFLGVGGRRIVPDRLQTPRSTEYQGFLGASLDTREERRNPRKGIFYRLETETGFKFNYPTATLPKVEKERSRVIKWRYEFHHWLPMGRSSNTRQVIYLSVQGGEVRTNEKEIPLYDLFKFGGATTLRGYQEQTFWGSRVVWANLEYRYLLSKEGRLFVFLDGGYYEDEVEKREFLLREEFPPRRFYPGYGVGLSLGSRLGLFGIAYGLGKGDSPFEGKIHFTLETEF